MATPKRRPLTIRQGVFLKVFPLCGTIARTAKCVGVNRKTHYHRRNRSPEYAAEFDAVRTKFVEELEAEAIRRARDGWLEPVFHKGGVVGHVRKYSSTLMIFMLKALKPAKYA